MQIDYVTEEDIEDMAQEVLLSFQKEHGMIRNHVPIENILEFHLGIHFEVFDDTFLPEQFKDQVLGYIDFRSNSVAVHESILPENNKGKTGRFNYTLAHEIGHGIMHKPYIMSYSGQMNCFEREQSQVLTSTTNPHKPRIEYQADSFAAFFTMPKNLVYCHWHDKYGHYNPITYSEITNTFKSHVYHKHPKSVLAQIYFKSFAEKLGVSAQALTIRLSSMGLLVENQQAILL